MSKIGTEFFLFETFKDFGPVFCGFERRGFTRKPCQLTTDECHEIRMAARLRMQPLGKASAVFCCGKNRFDVFNRFRRRKWPEVDLVVKANRWFRQTPDV